MSIFTLEAFDAKHGDALLLHYGEEESPRVVMIDGGPAGVSKRVIARLEELRASRVDGDEPLPIELLMVSHIDDDHIRGVVDLLGKLETAKREGGKALVRIRKLWHNSFEDLLRGPDPASAAGVAGAAAGGGGGAGPRPVPEPVLQEAAAVALASLDAAPPDDPTLLDEHPGVLILASVKQGREVHRIARFLGLTLNSPFRGLVRRKKPPQQPTLDGGLALRILGPSEERLEELRVEWETQAMTLDARALAARLAEYTDDSVFNLSSIVVLAEFDVEDETRRILLTGDARGDDILEAVRAAGMLDDDDGTMHVDVLKVPHHGSDRNVEQDFFETVIADTYVISADGRHGNPDLPTLEMLTAARGRARYTIVLTNPVQKIVKFLEGQQEEGARFELVVREATNPSVKIELGDALPD